MDSQTKKNSIKVLIRLRDVYQSQLDTSVIAEINAVIAALETECDCSEGCNVSKDRKLQILRIFGEVIRLVTNVTDLMN